MRRFLTSLAAYSVVFALVSPAHALAAGPGPDDKTRTTSRTAAATITLTTPAPTSSILLATTPSAHPARTELRLRDAVADAVKTVTTSARPARHSNGTPAPRRAPRAQYGGGGKGAMIATILTTVVSLGATVYMLKYLRDQQNEDGGDGGGN